LSGKELRSFNRETRQIREKTVLSFVRVVRVVCGLTNLFHPAFFWEALAKMEAASATEGAART
jgi:hypothetical protein